MERPAIIHIRDNFFKGKAELTSSGTKYRYADIEIEYLIVYEGLNVNYSRDNLSVRNIRMSNANYKKIENGAIFVVEGRLVTNNAFLTHFAVILKEFETVQIYNDKFISDIIKKVKFIVGEHVKEGLLFSKHTHLEEKTVDETQVMMNKFLKTVVENQSFLSELDDEMKQSNNLYLDIYDTDGCLSILTNDKGFDFYFDIGDMSNSFIPVNKKPFGIFLSHYHKDHYNVMNEYAFKAKHYILPYNSAITFKGKHYRSGDAVQFILSNLASVTIIVPGTPTPKGSRNTYSRIYESKHLRFYIPKYTNVINRNLESISVEFFNLAKSVFLPGDTMNYMYAKYMKCFDVFSASHHGGYIGKPNFKYFRPKETVVCTFANNYGTLDYINNLKYYKRNSGNVVVHEKNSGRCGTRIKLK